MSTISLAAVSVGGKLKTGEISMDSFLALSKAAGIDYVELCDRSIPQEPRLAELLHQQDVSVRSLAIRNDFCDPRHRRRELEHVLAWCARAVELGCSTVRVWTGWSSTSLEARSSIEEAFHELSNSGDLDPQLNVAIETHGGWSNDIQFMKRLSAIDSRFGVCIDYGNLPAPLLPKVHDLVEECNHVHVKSFKFDVNSRESTIPIEEATDIIYDARPDLDFVVEYEGPPPYLDGILATKNAIERAMVRTKTCAE